MVKPSDITPSSEQLTAWGYYGLPSSAVQKFGRKDEVHQAVGEVRYIIGWMADQMVRMGWRLSVDGTETWRLALPDGATAVSDAEEDDPEAETHPANAARQVLDAIMWDDAHVRQVTTNLFVAGELFYISERDTWSVMSVIDPKASERYKKASIRIRGLWPHPADPDSPDAPLFGVLGVLDDMLWLTRLSRSQSANRVGMRGILAVADEMRTATGTGDAASFWADMQEAWSRPMDDPSDVAPVGLRGPSELVKAEGKGMAGLTWVIPEFPYDDKIDARLEKLVQRLAYGLPIPPEILLGLQAQSRATAFQVEGNAYRAHIEPAAWTVAQVATDALSALLPDEVGAVRVIPDPTQILARRHTIEDVFEAFDRGAVGYDYLREVLAIPSRAEPTEEDIAIMRAIKGSRETVDVVRDPDAAEAAAGEDGLTARIRSAIVAAVTLPPGEIRDLAPVADEDDGAHLVAQLERIDDMVFFELVGAAEQAVTKAQERLGAAVRSRSAKTRAEIPANLSNADLALTLGQDALTQLGVDVPQAVSGAIEATVTWWGKRLAKAQSDVASLLARGDVAVDFSPSLAAESVDRLRTTLAAAVFGDLAPGDLREIIALAGE